MAVLRMVALSDGKGYAACLVQHYRVTSQQHHVIQVYIATQMDAELGQTSCDKYIAQSLDISIHLVSPYQLPILKQYMLKFSK